MEHLEHLYDESLYSDIKDFYDAEKSVYNAWAGRMYKYRSKNDNNARAKKKAVAKRRKRNKNKKTHRKK